VNSSIANALDELVLRIPMSFGNIWTDGSMSAFRPRVTSSDFQPFDGVRFIEKKERDRICV
jgi:hypothetical protein